MPDIFSRRKRSAVMAAIRGRENRSTELKLIAIMREHGVTGWRRGFVLMGKPDFVFPKQRLAVFVDGCFWHGCPKHGTLPKTNAVFWSAKIAYNRARDRRVTRTLKGLGWKVIRIWEHALAPKRVSRTVARISGLV